MFISIIAIFFLAVSSIQSSSTAQDIGNNPVASDKDLKENTEQQNPIDTEESNKLDRAVYKEYSETDIAKLKNKDIILFFSSYWCVICEAIDTEIKNEIDALSNDLVILKVDFDLNKELKEQYDVNIQHTFVKIDHKGNILKKWQSFNLENLLKQLQ